MKTPLLELGKIGNHKRVYMKDEAANLTCTFKDRLASAAVSRCVTDSLFGSISYGNTAVSFSRACQQSHCAEFVAFVPIGFSDWKFGPSTSRKVIWGGDYLRAIRAEGAHVVEVDLGSKFFSDDDLRIEAEQAGILRGRRFVNVTEGIDVPAYASIALEAIEQMGSAPDVCIVQYGAGILANEVKDVFNDFGASTHVVPVSTPNPESAAKMIYGPIWVDVAELEKSGFSRSLHSSPDRTGRVRKPYTVYQTSEREILEGIDIANSLSICAEPSGSVGLGVLDRLTSIVPSYEPDKHKVLLINTGNGIDRLACQS